MSTSPALAAQAPIAEGSPWSQTAPLFVVLNGGSGHIQAQERVDTVRRVFQEAGRHFELLEVSDPQQLPPTIARAIELARQHHGAVVAAGGDGTINAVVQQVLPTGLPLGILPQGTFNYFGRNQGISSDIEEAARSLLTAQLKPVQVGLINEQAFIVNASMGLYPTLLQDREAFKQRFGRSRVVALLASLATMLREHRDWVIKLTLDHSTHTIVTPTLFVGNNALQMEQIGIPEAPALQDGQLVAIAVKPVGKLAMLGLLLRGALGQLGDADKVSSFAFTSLTVSPRRPHRPRRLKVATDGEVIWMNTPLHFRPSPRPLMLLVPM
ncbi:diacylglycerol kinase family protein [Aquabacterium sp.]|uniref:diacylglycerol/lipid kinase family protein n=1 Tax=Aquabacterium sp. TaxID=1872578 RepID=UPI00248A3333|nr:diacylglycerol kinase family protein [Aquabacterium sp.]MDI1257753.1 diacylglycerol kinase family protein [Aquabacterium sp.]